MIRLNLPALSPFNPLPIIHLRVLAVWLLIFFPVLAVTFQTTAQPAITVQPASRTNNVGDNAQFTVTATGSGTLTYQWQSNNTNIAGATNNTLNVLVTDGGKAGDYRVLVSDTSNLTNTSSTAVLYIPYANRTKLTQWNFNNSPPDANVQTGVTTPSIGAGTFALVNMAANNYRVGPPSDPASLGTDNSARNFTGPTVVRPNKSAGFQITGISTVGYKNVAVTWELFVQAGGSAYWRGQYTTNGTDWVDRVLVNKRAAFLQVGATYSFHTDDLSDVPEARNCATFGYRVVAEYESTATGSGSAAYVASDGVSAFDPTSNSRSDMVTVLAAVDNNEVQPAVVVAPQSQTALVGDNVTFSVSATGGGLVYYWQTNGQFFSTGTVTSPTSSSLTVSNVQFSNGGAYSVIVSNSAGTATSAEATLTVIASLPPGERFWSGDGVTPGGAGTWDNTTPDRWGLSASGPFDLRWYNQNLDDATFVATGAAPGTVTVGSPVTVNRMTITNASGSAVYAFNGAGTITLTNDAEINFAGTTGSSAVNSVNINCIVSGTTITKSGGGRLNMSNTGNSVGRWIVKAGALTGDNANQVAGTGVPASLVTNYFTLDGGGLGFAVGTASSISVGANRGIYLGTNSGNKLGCQDTGKVTYNGPITGPGSVSFPTFSSWPGQLQGSAATFVFSNPGNNYEGSTTVGTGALQCGTNEVIPDSTTLTLTGSARLDVNGFTETVGNVIVNGSNARLQDSVGRGVLVATNYDVRQGGVQTAVLAGNANLTKTTASIITLGATNTYTGDTVLKNGTIALNGVGCFGTGAGTLYLDGSEGTIAIEMADTRTEANTLTNPVVFTAADVTIQTAGAATNDIVFRHSGSWTTSGGMLVLWNTSATNSFDALLGGAFDFTGPISIGPMASSRLTSYNPQGIDQTYSGSISGAGAFRRAGSGSAGRTVLTGDNSYSGGTLVEAGTLLVNNTSGSGTGFGSVTVSGGVLGGMGSIAGTVVVTNGGSIAAGAGAGNLTLQNGLDLSGGGTNVWELAALKDNISGVAGVDFDLLTLTGGELVLGGGSQLLLQFSGSASVPNSANPFWQAAHTWILVGLSGGQNSAHVGFASIANGVYNAGTFTNSVDGSGNILLTFTPAVPSAPHITNHPQSRTNIVGTTATFSIVATGSDPLTYEWFRTDAPFTAISGATNSTYTIVNVQAANAGDYFARAYNGLGNDTSQTARLTVAPRSQIQTPAVSGGDVTLNWSAIAGTAYQVQYATNLSTGNWFVLTNIVASGPTISVTDHPPANTLQRYYRLLIQ